MRLTSLTLANFRSFKEPQTIEFAPVTLLFGPNSVGKSSVLMALAYIQQILRKGHCDPQHLDALGGKKIGGFRSLVYGQDLESTISIKIGFEGASSIFEEYGTYVDEFANELQSVVYVIMNDFAGSIENGAVEFELAWSQKHSRAYVKNYRLWINDVFVGRISSSEDLKNTRITELNTQHPSLIPYENEEWLEREYGDPDDREAIDRLDFHTEFESVLSELNPNPSSTAEEADVSGAGVDFVNRVAPISLSCFAGAVPYLGRPIATNLTDQDIDGSSEHFNFMVVQQVLSQAFVLPLDKVLEHLESSIFIGPLRVVPDIDYLANPHPEQRDWVDGSAAWDMLHRDPAKDSDVKNLIENTSHWFADESKLSSGYEVVNQSLGDQLGSINLNAGIGKGLLEKRHVFFKEKASDIYLSANQLGTGISQILPIVVAANHESVGLISIEQPELHIHPRLQVELADLFVESRSNHSFLIETHSEHLMLRLLRRVREGAEADGVSGVLSPSEISVICLSPSSHGTQVERVAVTKDGDFEHDWPQGFFDERDEELF